MVQSNTEHKRRRFLPQDCTSTGPASSSLEPVRDYVEGQAFSKVFCLLTMAVEEKYNSKFVSKAKRAGLRFISGRSKENPRVAKIEELLDQLTSLPEVGR